MACAETVTWELSGQIDKIDGVATRLGTAAVGDSFTVLVTFDTAAVPLEIRPGDVSGARYLFQRVIQSYSFRLASGPALVYPSDFSGPDMVLLRDDFWDTVRNDWSCAGGVAPFKPFDGISLSVTSEESELPSSVILLRSATLDLVSGSVLPTDPDPRFATAEINVASFYDGSANATGRVTFLRRVDTVQTTRFRAGLSARATGP